MSRMGANKWARTLGWTIVVMATDLTTGQLFAEDKTDGKAGSSAADVKVDKASPRAVDRRVSQRAAEPTNILASLRQSAQSGASWLVNFQRPDGLFIYGLVPALNRTLAGENYLRQVGATAALARAASVLSNAEMALAARHAVLVLLESYTEVDAKEPTRRRPLLPANEANPIGFAGLLLWAICELPAAGDELNRSAEQLAHFIASRQRADGSFNLAASAGDDAEDPPEAINFYPGEALYGLMRSYVVNPAPWKLEVVKKAIGYYRRHWKENPSAAFVPWQTAAYAEAFLATRDRQFAEFVFEMNDWLLKIQYTDPQTVEAAWLGGFGSYRFGQTLWTPPGASTGSYVESLVEAWRVARATDDQERTASYQQAAERALRFLMTTQYTSAASTHFEPWFAKKIDGAFHASVEDGSIRIDYTQHAISGMLQYVRYSVPSSDTRVRSGDRNLLKAN
jgi:hypothetical protein